MDIAQISTAYSLSSTQLAFSVAALKTELDDTAAMAVETLAAGLSDAGMPASVPGLGDTIDIRI